MSRVWPLQDANPISERPALVILGCAGVGQPIACQDATPTEVPVGNQSSKGREVDISSMRDAIKRFEMARRLLNYGVTIEQEVLDHIFELDEFFIESECENSVRAMMVEYANALLRERDEQEYGEGELDCNFNYPSVPSVDITNLTIGYKNESGNMCITVRSGKVSIVRTNQMDPESPDDIALWLLSDGGDNNFELDKLRIVEGISVLIAHGMSVEYACDRARQHHIECNGGDIVHEIDSRRVGLWLLDRKWCQYAWQHMPDGDTLPKEIRDMAKTIRYAVSSPVLLG